MSLTARKVPGAWAGDGTPSTPALATAAVIVAGVVLATRGDAMVELATAAIGGVVLLAAVSRVRPVIVVGALSVVIPLQLVLESMLFRLGMPSGVISSMGALKEVVAVGLVFAALKVAREQGFRFDALDSLVIAYLVIATLHLLVPRLMAGPPGPGEGDISQHLRLLEFREEVMWPLLFMAARRVPSGADLRRLTARATIAVGCVLGGGAILETFFRPVWNTLVDLLGILAYRATALGASNLRTGEAIVVRTVGGVAERAGSFLFEPIYVGLLSLLPFALVILRLRSGATRGGWTAAVIIGTGILLSGTRTAIAAAALMCVVTAWTRDRTSGARPSTRARLGVAMAALAIVVGGAIVAGDRFRGTTNLSDPSSELHVEFASSAWERMLDRPMGGGYGTVGGGPSSAVRGTAAPRPESAYLSIGNEVGAISMILFILLLVGTIRRLARTRLPDEDRLAQLLPLALALTLTAFAFAGIVLSIWKVGVSFMMWSAAGFCLPRAAKRDVEPGPTNAILASR